MTSNPSVHDASALPVEWWKSSASGAQSDCLECGVVNDESVAVRDSKAPSGPALIFSRVALAAMVGAVAAGCL
ncbi:DUF397 domain-containing protein [Streptomyces sp. BE147]|uniref:DUF397 domain-containing protein n=1 Tax=Streptomyces sp. BE147 TaxID=3002524 RepID=UPI002E79938B|nr:DUF397 domain-containing protein [Streptomyces sp. BE147]MEE1740145.1 DUF397 domain-containing protein [Streptomyces sp. BE147]